MEETRKRSDKKISKTKEKDYDDKEEELSHENEEEKRRRKEIRRHKKVVDRLALLGLDENGEPLDNFSLLKYPVREWIFTLPGSREKIALNPAVTVLSMVGLWVLVMCLTFANEAVTEKLQFWFSAITLKFTWMFHGSRALLFFFVLYITYRYGHIRLGGKNDKPVFSSLSYFCMIFAADAGPRFLSYQVTEPMIHRYGNHFANAGYHSQDEIDMFAMNMTVVHWGVVSWTHYTLVAIAMALAGQRFKLPMTFRSCFYPILGDYTWGWMGDFVDSLAIVVTMACLATMLSITALQSIAGLTYMGFIDSENTSSEQAAMQNAIVWVITLVSTASVISGLQGGIQYMSIIAMSLGFFLAFLIYVMDDTKYLLNLQVQEVGYYLQNSIFQLNFWTDAFGQLREGSGRAVDGQAANQNWIESWTMFYQSWVISSSSVVGVFIAYVSRGRTIRNVVFYSLVAPIVYCIFWFCTWGGIGFRQSRQAMELSVMGERYFNNSGHFLIDGSEACYDVPQESLEVDGEVIFTNYLPGITPVCTFDVKNYLATPFNVLNSFRFPDSFGGAGLGPFLSTTFLLCCAIFFVATSDSSTFIVDCLASNGRKNFHWSRRTFWACTTGLQATMIVSTQTEALLVLKPAIFICGLPMAILLCYLVQSIVLLCEAADKTNELTDDTDYVFPDQPVFSMPVYGGVFNLMEYLMSVGQVNTARVEKQMHRATNDQILEFFKGLVVPFVSLHQILSATYPQNPKTNALVAGCFGVCFVVGVSLALAAFFYPGFHGLAWTIMLMTGIQLAIIRSGFRSLHNLRSNSLADFTSSMFLWPQVLTQMQLHEVARMNKDKPKHEVNDVDDDDDNDNEESEDTMQVKC